VLSACRWSVPADPGRNAALRARPEPVEATSGASAPAPSAADADPGAGALYASRCAQCHEPFAPGTFTAGEWPIYVDRYGPRAGLFGSERARVLRWLQAHAR
jgi:mono/diheme cytochrome c family protein